MSEREPDATSAISGRVLVAGCGLIVTGAAWALFGFVEHLESAALLSATFFILSAVHAVAGVATLIRQRYAWIVALLIGTLGLILALSELQFVLVTTNVVTLLLLVLARGDIAGTSTPTVQRGTEIEHGA